MPLPAPDLTSPYIFIMIMYESSGNMAAERYMSKEAINVPCAINIANNANVANTIMQLY